MMKQLRTTTQKQLTFCLMIFVLTAGFGCQGFNDLIERLPSLPKWSPTRDDDGPKVTYIPGTRQVVRIEEGKPSPITGFGVPPALMADIGPCIAESLREPEFETQLRPVPEVETSSNKTFPPEPASQLHTAFQFPAMPKPEPVDKRLTERPYVRANNDGTIELVPMPSTEAFTPGFNKPGFIR